MSLPFLPGRAQTGRFVDLARLLLALLAVVALAAALLWSMGSERRAIRGMAPAERRAVYERTYAELVQLCGAGPREDALEQRCTELIRFVEQFPECDAGCQAIARRHQPRPTK